MIKINSQLEFMYRWSFCHRYSQLGVNLPRPPKGILSQKRVLKTNHHCQPWSQHSQSTGHTRRELAVNQYIIAARKCTWSIQDNTTFNQVN